MSKALGNWYRKSPFGADHLNSYVETWEYVTEGNIESFDVEVKIGKSLDVVSLKGSGLDEVREYAQFLKETAAKLYHDKQDYADLENCVMCQNPFDAQETVLTVFDIAYERCLHCGHVAVSKQPKQVKLNEVFEDSETHSSIYVDEKTLAVRMAQVVQPKLQWVKDQYSARYAKPITKLADIGAGGGHFVAGARKDDINAQGFEKSKTSQRFCQKAFGFELKDEDFLTSNEAGFDVITMWGLLEYVQEPRAFLKAARQKLSNDGLLIVEVPRVDGLGTLVQSMDGAVIARHMDPTSHVNGFTDQSLCNALLAEGFIPVGAWYFGMDAYETIVQMSLHLGEDVFFDRLVDFIPALQFACDHGKQCDDIIIAAIPV